MKDYLLPGDIITHINGTDIRYMKTGKQQKNLLLSLSPDPKTDLIHMKKISVNSQLVGGLKSLILSAHGSPESIQFDNDILFTQKSGRFIGKRIFQIYPF